MDEPRQDSAMSETPISTLLDSLDALTLVQKEVPIETVEQKALSSSVVSQPTALPETKANPLQAVQKIQNVHDLTLLSAIETLLELPLNPQGTAKAPAHSDVEIFKQELQILRPNDYDDLIEERNIDHRCGYALCPKSLASSKRSSHGKFRILTTATGKGRVVEKRVLDRFCQEDCARRALYVRVQLNEEPGWLRAGLEDGDLGHTPIILMDEKPYSSLDYEKPTSMKQDEAHVLDQLSKLGIQNPEISIQDKY